MFNFWWSARLVNGLEPHLPPLSSQKNEILIFGIHSTSHVWPGWSMDSNCICHPFPAKKMKCSFLGYVQLLMISQASRWTWTPSATHLQSIKWNAHFWNTFNFWWSARLVNGLQPHLPPLCHQKHEILIFWLHSTSNDRPGWSMDSNPICPPLQPKKWNANFWISFNFWWLPGLVDGLKPHLPPLSSQKNEMLIFGFRSTSDDCQGLSIDSNSIHHPSPAKKMKCSFLDYIQILMISQVGRWTRTPSATPLQPKTWNAHFWITFNFQWLARLVNGLKLHLPPISSQKNEMLVFGLPLTSDDRLGWSMELNPIYHLSPAKKMKCSFLDYVQLLMIGRTGRWTWALCATSLQPKKWNVHFWITFNFWWLVRLVDGLQPYLPPLSSQKHEMLFFGLHSTPDDQPGWSMNSNPIYHLSPATKIKCSFLDYVQLLMISWIGQWTRMPSTTPLQPKTWNACFWITFNFWWLARLVDALKPHLPPLSSQKIEMLIFGLHSTSDDQLGWSMELNPIYHLSPAKKMKCSFLDYIQILMISQAGWWTRTPSATPLQPKEWNPNFWNTFNFSCLAGLVDGFKPHLPPLCTQKNEMLIFGFRSTSDDCPGWTMDSNPICHPSAAKKWNAHFWVMFNFWWSARLVNGLKPHLPPISSQKHEMLIFGLRSTSDDQLDWSMDSNAIHHPSPAKKMKCLFLDNVQLLMISPAGQWTQIPSATSLQPKKWNAHFWITFNFWWLAGLVDGLEPCVPPLCSQKNEMPIFRLHSTYDWPGWSKDSNLICHPSPAKNMKCLFLDYIQLLMIGQAGRCTRTPFATSLQPQK